MKNREAAKEEGNLREDHGFDRDGWEEWRRKCETETEKEKAEGRDGKRDEIEEKESK